MSRSTLQTIGDQLGLSRSTVSRALQHDPRIPLKTRKRVQSIAKKVDYHPNQIMSELASSHWQNAKVAKGIVIGYIDRICGPRGGKFPEFCRQHALSLGYQIEIFRRSEFNSSTKLQATLRNRGITDLILSPLYEKALSIDLDWSKFICVQLLPGLLALPMHSVVKDHFNTVVLAWQKAVSYGYKRIGITLLKHQEQLMDDVLRTSAAHACQNVLFPHLPVIPPFYFPEGPMEKAPFIQWVSEHAPDVVIGFSTVHYPFTVSKSKRKLSFVCLHTHMEIGISGIPDPLEYSSIEGVNLLHFCRRTHQWGIPRQRIDHVLEPLWFEGKTMPKLR